MLARRCAAASALAAVFALIICGSGNKGRTIRVRFGGGEETAQAETEAEARGGAELSSLLLPVSSASENACGEYELASPKVAVSIEGELALMELEEYITGVVAAEMPASAEPAALQAQAVAARTFTALHMSGGAKCKSGAEGCSVCTDPGCCQAYMSRERLKAYWGSDYERNIKRIENAVASTRGLVLLYGGRPISALYHASSGPATENSEAVFAVALPYLVSVESFEGEKEQVSVSAFGEQELADILNSAHADAQLSAPLKQNDIEVWGRTESGRVQLVRIGGTVITGQQMRELLGLKSTAFTVQIADGMVSFTCVGFGHGVGMSQCGANEMAKAGYGFEDILLHFYTGAELARLEYTGE